MPIGSYAKSVRNFASCRTAFTILLTGVTVEREKGATAVVIIFND